MKLTDINDIHELLGRHGFRFSKSMGQNFLTAAWVPEQIADSATLDEHTCVLEIGPGIGCLTEQLAQRADKVLCVELDNALRPVLNETLGGFDNVEILFGDVLKQDLPALVHEHFGTERAVVCANLPYNVTTPLLTALIGAGCFDTITVMIQREVARRICAGANTADYGAFGIFVQWHCETELLFDVAPGCFVPQPKVTSSVIHLKLRKEPLYEVSDEALFFRIVRAAFNQRRKTLANALASGLGMERSGIESAIANAGFDTRIRGEAVDVGGFVKITEEIHRLKQANL